MKKFIFISLFFLLLHSFSAASAGNQLDYPHSTTNNVNCADCHYTASLTLLDPAWTNNPPANIDDLPYNNFCWNCHDGSAAQAVETHSSRTTSEQYGQWNIECRTCHWPHHIMQYRAYGAESFEESGISQTVTSSTLTVAGMPWSVDQFKGYILMPDIAKETFNYKIASNTENTITVTGSIDTAQISAGNTFAIIYGNLVKAIIATPNSGDKQVKFFRAQGANSFADGDATYNGPCEVCHTKTNHFRNNGTAPEQNHENIDGGKQGSNCVGICHSHANGFAHGQGSGGADGCVQCHGHEAGTNYDPDMRSPYTPDPAKVSQGKGTTKSHSTHTEIDADDQKGPAIYCDDCHDIADIPYFKAGIDGDGDGKFNLAETTVCDPCHTPGGIVDGINDPAVGVKNNWRNGIYESDSLTLAAGKEMWCISCHDQDPSNSKPDGSGIAAPNKAGDGSTYGYYLTGHGNSGPYNATLHGQNGPGYVCTVCHDASAPHFDHAVGATRLKNVGDDGLDYTTNVSEVCLDCHKVGQTNPGALGYDSVAEATVHSGGVSGGYNTAVSAVFPSYGDAAGYASNTGYQCDDCHEVHGTSKLAMVIETIDGNVGGASNPVAVQGFEASDADMMDLDPTAAADDGVCDLCHAAAADPHPDTNHAANHNQATNADGCVLCHNHRDSFRHGGGATGVGCGSSTECHGLQKSHPTHVGSNVGIGCDGCHDVNDFPNFKSGVDSNGDGKFNLAETTACDECHTPDGATIAKQNFAMPGSWSGTLGEAAYCGSCHDETPGSYQGAAAPNVVGDNANYGFFVTGHGRTLAQGNYPPLIWQDAAAAGNASAQRACGDCHDHSLSHFNADPALKRLKAGWENDASNSNCFQCHDEAGSNYIAASDPKYFVDIASYDLSGHGRPLMPDPGGARSVKCTDCHEVHGAVKDASGNGLPGMAKGEQENLCYQCHTDGVVVNYSVSGYKGTHTGSDNQSAIVDAAASFPGALSGGSLGGWIVYNITDGSKGAIPAYVYNDYGPTSVPTTLSGGVENDWDNGDEYSIVWEDDIEQAFASPEIHDLGTQFGIGTKTYSLECVSCHNVHTVTGKYWDAEAGLSPITRFPPDNPANFAPWGDEAGEKMDDYAGGGTYRTPNSETFGGAALPDYPSFCLDCHGQSSTGHANFGIDWNNDPHGKNSANEPNGHGTCPNWYTCGKAEGWDGDACVGGEETCWPVMTRGLGDMLWSRSPFNHEERIGGANFTLSCTNCHEAHGAASSSMIRPNPNNGKGTIVWNDMCNNCHYYYSDWHAGMSCGNASCHVQNSIHRMDKNHGSGATRTFDRELVLHYAFQDNLKDSGDWQMDGGWRVTAGSFAAGKVGNALLVNDNPVEVGTENEFWSTDEGYHGTWKYTDMKYNMTLEAWINPSVDDGERKIMAKHTYWTGGYAMVLKKFDGSLRFGLLTNVDPGVNNYWDADCNGLRGAFSSVTIPLNTWTHVAATYDAAGPDRNPADGSVGRIRLYVNGEDVTDSYADDTLCYAQPGPGETAMWPHSANNDDPVGECYNDSWCASALSVGGLNWSAPNDNFIGLLDEVKVWNITKDAAYFTTQIDPAAGPYISKVEGAIGSAELTVYFSEGVYGAVGAIDPLAPGDFILTNSVGRTISGVSHVPGSAVAAITMSGPMGPGDFLTDSLMPAPNEIFDEYDVPADNVSASIEMITACPTGPTTSIQLNEPAGSGFVFDDEAALFGEVSGTGAMTGTSFSGDGAGNYIMFNYNQTCLQASTAMTVEARIKPTGIPTDAPPAGTSYIKRILARDGGSNYQLSVWSTWGDPTWPDFNPPAGEASIALWVKPVDARGGNAWKPVFTNYTQASPGGNETSCPIVNDHWYKIKAVWDTNRPGGTLGSEFVPADIFIDDQGTLGDDADENWAGYINCTDRDQSLTQSEANKHLYTGDEITPADGPIAIGVNVNNQANNLFSGEIDWITWQAAVDYTDITDVLPSGGEAAAPLSGASAGTAASAGGDLTGQVAAALPIALDGGSQALTEANATIAVAAITGVEGTIGSNRLLVSFSGGVYTDVGPEAGPTGALGIDDFELVDLDDVRTIIDVEHTAGTSTAILTLSSMLDARNDINVDEVIIAADSVFNRTGEPLASAPMLIFSNSCPPAGTIFNFEEAAGNQIVHDQASLLFGAVGNKAFSLQGDGYYVGDATEGASTFIDVDNNGQCLSSPRASTLEARFFLGEVDLDFADLDGNATDDDYDAGGAVSLDGDGRNATRSVIAARDETFSLSVSRANWSVEEDWRKPGRARLEFSYKASGLADCGGGAQSMWKTVSTSIDDHPLVKGHWYRVKTVFNSDKPGSPVDIWLDDQGADGASEPTQGSGELWAGFINISPVYVPGGECSSTPAAGQEMTGGSGFLRIGDDPDHSDIQGDSQNQMLKGKIDWLGWRPVVDYSGVDDSPL